MRTRNCVGGAALSALLLVAAPGIARADGIPFLSGTLGSAVLYQGGDVFLKFLYEKADFTNELFVFNQTTGQTFDANSAVHVFNNQATPVGTEFTFNPHALWGLNAGDELIFAICTNTPAGSGVTCGDFGDADAIMYGGDGSRNPDGVAHARFEDHCSVAEICGSYTGSALGFEDLPDNRSDHDYNDIVFGVRQEATSTTPEPVTMVLLSTGLAGMGGAGLFRRRRQQH